MTATLGADSGNDDEEEDGGLGVGLEAPAGFMVGQRIRMKPPTVEHFYFSDNFACIFAHKVSQPTSATTTDASGRATVLRTHSLLVSVPELD